MLSLWIDGPKLVEWMEEVGIIGPDKETVESARYWRQGRRANVYSVDALLIERGHCLGEIPDEFYITSPKNAPGFGKVKRKEDKRKEVLPASTVDMNFLARAFEKDIPMRVIARKLHISQERIARYKEEWQRERFARDCDSWVQTTYNITPED